MRRALLGVIALSTGLGCDRGSSGEGGSAPAKSVAAAESKAAESEAAEGKAAEGEAAEGEAAEGKAAESKAAADNATTGDGAGAGSSDGPPPTLPEGPAGASPWTATVEDIVEVSKSARVRIAADAEGEEQSIVWAQPVDAEGAAVGPAVKLRTTNGDIDSVAAAFDGTTLWVGWRASLPKGERGIAGLAGWDLSLKQTIKTKTLRFFRWGSVYPDEAMQLVARPDSGGVVVVTISGSVLCKGMFFEEEGKVDCPQLTVDVVGPDGSVELTETSELEGGDPSFTVTEGDDGLAVEFLAYRGGAGTDTVYVSYAAKAEALSTCGFAPVMAAWVDGGLLSLCGDPDVTDELALSCSPSKPSACGVFFFQRPSGKTGTMAIPEGREVPFDRLALGCKGGASTLRIGWKGGHIDAPNETLGFEGPGAEMKDGKCTGTPFR